MDARRHDFTWAPALGHWLVTLTCHNCGFNGAYAVHFRLPLDITCPECSQPTFHADGTIVPLPPDHESVVTFLVERGITRLNAN